MTTEGRFAELFVQLDRFQAEWDRLCSEIEKLSAAINAVYPSITTESSDACGGGGTYTVDSLGASCTTNAKRGSLPA